MANVEQIERAIEQLPPDELATFRRWFAEFDSAAWDAQIEADAAGGKFDAMAEEAFAEYRLRGSWASPIFTLQSRGRS